MIPTLYELIKEGVLADIPSNHQMTIDRQVERGRSMGLLTE